MLAIFGYLLLFVVAVVGITIAIQFHRFRSWPPYEWQQRVYRHIQQLESREEKLLGAANRFERRLEDLAVEYFERHLKSISLRRLGEFPGIGSATLDRLEQAGWRTLHDAHVRQPTGISGIGPARANDISRAVAFLIKSMRSQFEAGGCPAAHAYQSEVESLRREEEVNARLREKELGAIEAAIKQCQPFLEVAKRVTFSAFLSNRGVDGLTDEVFERKLPEPIAVGELISDPTGEEIVGIPRTQSHRNERSDPRSSPPPVNTRPRVTTIERRPSEVAAQVRPIADRSVKAQSRTSSEHKQKSVQPVDPFELDERPSASAIPPVTVHPLLPKLRVFTEFALLVAKIDGRVAQRERKQIRMYLSSKFGHEDRLLRHIDPLMEQVEAAVADEVRTLRDMCKLTDLPEKKELLKLAESIADACGTRNRREEALLARIGIAFELSSSAGSVVAPPAVKSKASNFAPNTQNDVDYRRTLEIADDVAISVELIRRRYRLLAERLDPAKAAAISPKFQKTVEAERDEVRQAAEALLRPLGAPLEEPTVAPSQAELRHNPDLDEFMGG